MLIVIIVSLIMGGLCAYFSKKRGRNPYIWFTNGFFFGILGLILLFVFPVKKSLEEGTIETPPPMPMPEGPPLFWYYLDNDHVQHGPMSATNFDFARTSGQITSSNYVWNTDMENWKKLEEI